MLVDWYSWNCGLVSVDVECWSYCFWFYVVWLELVVCYFVWLLGCKECVVGVFFVGVYGYLLGWVGLVVWLFVWVWEWW